jgi:predicted permease
VRRSALTGHRLAAAFLVGLLLFCSPVTALFDRPASWSHIPVLYLYLFGAWAMFIALLAWILGGRE